MSERGYGPFTGRQFTVPGHETAIRAHHRFRQEKQMIDIRSLLNPAGWIAISLFATVILAASSLTAAAQPEGDIGSGHRIAETWCSTCHVIGPEQQHGTSTGAPTFTEIAQMKSTTKLGLQVFLQTPHDRMPDLHLSRAEMNDLIAYIVSLRR
jgi:mono/diheme cytochrome c family protein